VRSRNSATKKCAAHTVGNRLFRQRDRSYSTPISFVQFPFRQFGTEVTALYEMNRRPPAFAASSQPSHHKLDNDCTGMKNVQQIAQDLYGVWKTAALLSAVQLNVFGVLAKGTRSVPAVAAAIGGSERGTRLLLEALVALEYVVKQEQEYFLSSELCDLHILLKSPYLKAAFLLVQNTWNDWGQLTRAVRDGSAIVPYGSDHFKKEVFPQIADALFYGHYGVARDLAKRLASEFSVARTILDVGAGSAAWSIPFAQFLPGVEVTAIDLPEVLPTTKRFTEFLQISSRYTFVGADIRHYKYSDCSYDLIILGHVIHCIGMNAGRDLVSRLFGALRTGGKILIAELLSDSADQVPGSLFNLHLMLHTDRGEVLSMEDYMQILRAVGFEESTIQTISSPASIVILASK
jgi:ubiquinone/menaquinone biosynthesis C-methylase UbiE